MKDTFAPRLAAFYAALFAFAGVQMPFFPVWLEAGGLDAEAIGVILAVPLVVRVLIVPFATRLIDRFAVLEVALPAAATAAVGGYVLVGFGSGFSVIFAAVALASVALTPLMPLADAYALRGLAQRSRSYGSVRLWGSASFILANVAAGFLLNRIAHERLIWVMVAPLAATALAALRLVRGGDGHPLVAEQTTAEVSPWRSPRLVGVILAASLVQASHAVFYGFSTVHWASKGLGGATIGALWGLGVVAEILLFALAERLPGRLSGVQLIVVGAFGAVLRWSLMALDPPTVALAFIQGLHALSFAATHLGAMQFLAGIVSARRGATAQGDFATLQAVSMALAMASSGALFAAYGPLAYAAMAILAAAGGSMALAASRHSNGPATIR